LNVTSRMVMGVKSSGSLMDRYSPKSVGWCVCSPPADPAIHDSSGGKRQIGK